MRPKVLALLLALVTIAPLGYIAYNGWRLVNPCGSDESLAFIDFPTAKSLEPGATFEISSCYVLDGYRFELGVAGHNCFEAHLTAATHKGAGQLVAEWFKQTTGPSPTVTLRRKVGNVWLVDIELTIGGKRVSLVDHLAANKQLLYTR